MGEHAERHACYGVSLKIGLTAAASVRYVRGKVTSAGRRCQKPSGGNEAATRR